MNKRSFAVTLSFLPISNILLGLNYQQAEYEEDNETKYVEIYTLGIILFNLEFTRYL